MYDQDNDNGQDSDAAIGTTHKSGGEGDYSPMAEGNPTHGDQGDAHQTDGDQTGAFANFVRKQPILTLSLAFGLGLLATSLLARKRT